MKNNTIVNKLALSVAVILITFFSLFTIMNIDHNKNKAEILNTNYSLMRANGDWEDHPGLKDEVTNDDLVSVNQLPVTGPQRPAAVMFDRTGTTLKTDIYFEGRHYIYMTTFEKGTNLEMFDSRDTLYMNDGLNEPQIFINLDDTRPYLRDILSVPEDEKPAFIPHTIWFMKSNELKTNLTFDAYMYIKDEGGVFYAYYYTDEFVMDKILNITMEYSLQNWINPLTPFKKSYFEDPVRYTETFHSDEMLEYKNRSTGWFLKLLPISSYIDQKSGASLRVNRKVPRIQEYTEKNQTFMREMSDHFKSVNDNFEQSTFGSKKIFKIAIAEGKELRGFWGASGEKTYIYHNNDNKKDKDNIKVISIQYETNGKIYESKGEDMNLYVGVAARIDAIKKAKAMKKGDSFTDKIKTVGMVLITIMGLSIVWTVIKDYKAKKKVE